MSAFEKAQALRPNLNVRFATVAAKQKRTFAHLGSINLPIFS